MRSDALALKGAAGNCGVADSVLHRHWFEKAPSNDDPGSLYDGMYAGRDCCLAIYFWGRGLTL